MRQIAIGQNFFNIGEFGDFNRLEGQIVDENDILVEERGTTLELSGERSFAYVDLEEQIHINAQGKKSISSDITDVIGTAFGDEIYGDVRNNLIHGNDGNDYIKAYDGDDKIYGDVGDDRLYGGKGQDIIYGGADNDSLYGEENDDWLHGGAGENEIYGGDGQDWLIGGDEKDTLYGGSGDDILDGNEGDDGLLGGEGNDDLAGGGGNDFLDGHEGDDVLWGMNGNDFILTGTGKDVVYGGRDNDTIIDTENVHRNFRRSDLRGEGDLFDGGEGDDEIVAYGYYDDILGGSGNDKVTSEFSFGSAYSLGDNNDRLTIKNGDNNFVDGGNGNDTLDAGPGNNTIYGGTGADVFVIKNNPSVATKGDILDFTIADDDKIQFVDTSLKSFTDVQNHSFALGKNTIITSDNVRVELHLVELSTLSANNFIF